MEKIGLIISNHAAEPKTEEALKRMAMVKKVLYFKHPEIDPELDKKEVWQQAFIFVAEIFKHIAKDETIQICIINGEYSFSVACVKLFEFLEIPSYFPTTRRNATEEIHKDGTIETKHIYEFVQFRKW